MLVRKDDHWNRSLDIPDIRGWRVVDANDRSIGFVQSVVVDREANSLEAILIGANERFEAGNLDVQQGVVRLRAPVASKAKRTTDDPGSYSSFEDAFRDHFRQKYSDAEHGDERSFADFSEAYTFGRLMALDADFTGRRYERAQEDLRAHWTLQRRTLGYDQVEDAVAFAYEFTHGIGTYRSTGMERERQQILGGTDREENASKRAAAHMTMGSPPRGDGSGR